LVDHHGVFRTMPPNGLAIWRAER